MIFLLTKLFMFWYIGKQLADSRRKGKIFKMNRFLAFSAQQKYHSGTLLDDAATASSSTAKLS